MNEQINFTHASSGAIAADLCQRLDRIRLDKNVSQAELADEAGVSRSTLTRMADGRSVSLDSFIRVVKALGMADNLAEMLPLHEPEDVELTSYTGHLRRRATGSRKTRQEEDWQPATEPSEP